MTCILKCPIAEHDFYFKLRDKMNKLGVSNELKFGRTEVSISLNLLELEPHLQKLEHKDMPLAEAVRAIVLGT